MTMMKKIGFPMGSSAVFELSLGCFLKKKNPWLDQDVMDVSLKLNGKRCHSIIPLL